MDCKYTVEIFPPPVSLDIKRQADVMSKACGGKERRSEDPNVHADKFCSHRNLYRFIVGTMDQRVVSRVIALTREITIDGDNVLLGGIGGVLTHPAYRGKGIASMLIKQAMRELRLAHCDIAYLCTNVSDPRLVNLYAKFGFVVLKKPYTFLGKSGKRYLSHDGMIAPIDSKIIFEKIINSVDPLDIGVGNW